MHSSRVRKVLGSHLRWFLSKGRCFICGKSGQVTRSNDLGVSVVLCDFHRKHTVLYIRYLGFEMYEVSLEIDFLDIQCGNFHYTEVSEIVFDLFKVSDDEGDEDRWKQTVRMSK